MVVDEPIQTGRKVNPFGPESYQSRNRKQQAKVFIPRRPQRDFIPEYSLPVEKPPENWLWSDMMSG